MIAEIDSKGLVPDVNRANNVAASSNPINVALPSAPLGQTVSGTIANGQDVYYQITVPAGQDLAINASFAALQGGELYVGYQSVPTIEHVPGFFDLANTDHTAGRHSRHPGRDVLHPAPGRHRLDRRPAVHAVRPQSLPLQVTGVSPAQAGNSGTTTLTIQGAEFTAGRDGQPRSPRRRHARSSRRR